MGLEEDTEKSWLKEDCTNCDSYIKKNIKAKCEEGNNMNEMKKKNYPCFLRNASVMEYANYKDEFGNICKD